MATHADEASHVRLRRLLRDVDLPVERVRARISAYIYGNFLALAAVLEAGPVAIRTGSALLVVLITTGTTYLAHVLAYHIGGRIGRTPDEHRHELRTELRDALPIATSGLLPALPLLLGLLGWLPPPVAQIVAVVLLLIRLAWLGRIVGRLTHRSTVLPWVSGLALTAVGAVVAILKVAFLH